MNVCRSQRVRPRLAALALAGLLIGQTLVPCGMVLSSVHAAELRVVKQSSAAKTQNAPIPAWARELEKRAAQQQREQKARLAQWAQPGQNDNNGNDAPSEDLDCLDCEVDLNPLDLSDVPTEKALRLAGGSDGALYPMRRAEPRELGIKLDRLLKRVGVEGGLRGQLPPKDPRFMALKRAQQRYERARAINLLFGRAVKQWRQGDRAGATELFAQYMKDYPKTPWSGEALLHLGYEAKDGGRLVEAQDIFQTIQDKTSAKPNKELRAKKRERKTRGADVTDDEREADVDKALAGVTSLEEAVAKLDSSEASDEDDESFEIHMKAKQQLADIDMAMGHFNDAADKMLEIMKEDTDWHRRVWARNQLQRSNILKHSGASQMACGPQSLKMVMVGLHKSAGAKKMEEAIAPRVQGFSMAELQTLAAKNGIAMRGFRSDVSQLSKIALPAILHYDFGRDSETKKASGHFVVLQGVDAKSHKVRLFDPLNKKSLRLSYAQLQRQWSGKGLETAGRSVPLVGEPMDVQTMKDAVGSSTTFSTDHDLGYTGNNVSVGVGDGVTAPLVQINQASFNVYAQHTLLSYQPARGPAVEITATYNSGLADDVGFSSLGAKWNLNYSSTAQATDSYNNPFFEDVTIRMPDGSQDRYSKRQVNQQYTSLLYGEEGNFNTVEKTSATERVLTFPDGTKWTYTRVGGHDNDFPLVLTKITDARNLSLKLNYSADSEGKQRLSSIVDAENRATNFTWYAGTPSQVAAVNTITDPFGRRVVFTYRYSLLKVITDALNQQFKFEYSADSSGNIAGDLASIETPKINPDQLPWQIKREYPILQAGTDTVVTVTNPLGDKEGFSYDNSNGRMFHVTPNRYATPYNHYSSWQTQRVFGISVNGESVPKHINYADGTRTTYSFDNQHGLLSQIVNRQGQTTKFFYNDKGQLNLKIDPKNIQTSIEYAANGLDAERFIQPKPDGNGSIVAKTVVYNAYHQPLSITDVNGTTTYLYNDFGSLLTTTDPQERVTRNVYNAAGRLTSVENSDRPTTGPFNWVKVAGFTYDAEGRVKTVTDAANLATSYDYNKLDQVITIVHPDPDPTKQKEEILYLNGDLPVRVKDRFGRYSYTEYDALKRERKSYVYDAQNNLPVGTTQTDYDKNSNLTQLIDAKGNATQWAYDRLDRAIGKQYHDGTSESYTYQSLAAGATPAARTGRLFSTTGTRGQVIYYNYDQSGNQTKIEYANAATPDVTMDYNALNDVRVINDGVGTHNLNYDDYGRLISNAGPLDADTQTYTYDELERIETQTVERGASGGVQSQTFAYDALGRLSSLNANGTQGTGLTTYSYDGNTDRLRILAHPNGTKTDLRYDAIGRLAYNFNGVTGNTLYNRYAYQYDSRDVKTVMQTRTGGDSVPIQTAYYTYDALDQLKQERVTGGVAGTAYTHNYNYDAMGNRTQADKTSIAADGTSSVTTIAGVPNALNQLSGLTTTFNNGSTNSSSLTYDASGNLTRSLSNNNGTRTVYFYDDADRLTRIEKRNAADAPLSKSEFVYDYASRKAISREFNYTNGAWVQTDEKRRVFDGMDVVQERNGANQVTAQLVRDGNIGGILSRTTAAGATFYGYDGNGNVTLLTNGAGQDVGHYRYDAFGNTLEAAGQRAGENPYRFSTKELHGPSGLYDYGFRFYSPSMGRWLNRDPLQEVGGINLYAAMGNNAVNSVDEYGLWVWWLTNDGWRKRVDPFITAPKAQSIEGEDPAETLIREKKAVDKLVVSTGKTTVGTAYNAMYNELPQQMMGAAVGKGLGAAAKGIGAISGKGSNVYTSLNLNRLGKAGRSSGVRVIQGGPSKGWRMFNNLRGSNTYTRRGPNLFTASGKYGGTVTFRPTSPSGPPTVELHGRGYDFKFKFVK